MLTRDAFEALLEACMKSEAGDWDPFFLRRSIKEVKEDMLPGFRSLSKMERDAVSSPLKVVRVGDSVDSGASALCRSFD